jgi:uracil-DNA glycosylase
MDRLLSAKKYEYKSWQEKFPDNKVNILDLYVDDSWKWIKIILKNDKRTDGINSVINKSITDNKQVYPYPDLLFNALNSIDYKDIKVVILGMDSYFNSREINNKIIPEAMGMAFSIPVNIPIPSSLNNIYKNAIKYKHMFKFPKHGNLTFWANQGVLLLNSGLTVQEKKAGSHIKHWEWFTDILIEKIAKENENIVFVLWGAFAAKKKHLIDETKHKVIITSHPSGLSVNTVYQGYAFANYDHFGEINKYLKKYNKDEIVWQII